MVLLALSLSLSDQVQKYGSYVGIAAFFGLAILSLLYFAQAREVKRLREWAGRAPERAREVEEAALAAADAARLRPPPVAVPQAAPQPVAAATAAGGRSGTVSPAVAVGTAVAERERPEGEASEDEADEAAVVEGPVTADGRRPVAAKAPEVAAPADESDDEPDGEGDDEDLRDEAADADTDGDEEADAQPAPAATSPSNGAPPAGAEPPMIPRPSTAAGVAGAGGAAAASAGAGPAPAAPNRPAPAMPLRSAPPTASPRQAVTQPPRRPLPPPAPASSGHGGRRWAIAGGVLAVIAALGIYAATQLLNDDTPTTPNRAATPTASATESATASGGGQKSTSRGSTTVAVFNGTTYAGLASSTADKLAGSGYKRGSTGDFTDQQRATSTIFYRAAARRQARDIGRELKISDLRPMDAETQALAGQGADVAVVVGSDKAP